MLGVTVQNDNYYHSLGVGQSSYCRVEQMIQTVTHWRNGWLMSVLFAATLVSQSEVRLFIFVITFLTVKQWGWIFGRDTAEKICIKVTRQFWHLFVSRRYFTS